MSVAQAVPVNGSPRQPPTTFDPSQVHLVDPHLVSPAPGQREVDDERVRSEIVPSMEQPHGQIVPGISYRDPDRPGCLLCVDGNHRLAGARWLGLKFRTMILDHVPTPSEVRRYRFAIATKHKAHDAVELGADLFAEREETGCSLDALAEAFDITTGWASKLLSPYLRGAPELLAAIKSGDVIVTSAPSIASLPEEKQPPLIKELAAIRAADPKKRPVKRARVESMVRKLKGVREKKEKPLELKSGGVTARIAGNPVEALRAFIAKGAEALKKLEKEGLSPELLPALMK